MTQGDVPAQRFLPRIRQELDKLPLTEEQKDAVTPKLLKHIAFLDTSGGRHDTGRLNPDSPFFNFADKLHTIVAALQKDGLTLETYLSAALKDPVLLCISPETTIRHFETAVSRFEPDGLTRQDYLKATLKHPPLLHLSPDTIAGNITELAKRFEPDGLSTRDCLKAAIKEPCLFSMRPETVAGNVTALVQRFEADGLSTRQYLKAATEQPQLFYQSPDTLERNIRGVVDLFTADGLTTREYLRAALKQPSNFTQSPETLANNIIGVTERFKAEGLTVTQYLKAALKQQSLFGMSPETVARHITEVVERFRHDGLTTREYLKAALSQPSLFTQSPETIARHIDTVLNFADSGIFKPPAQRRKGDRRVGPSENPTHSAVIDFLLRNPALMCLADDNYGLREVHQRLTNGPTDRKMMTDPRYAVETAMMGYLGHPNPLASVPNDGFVAGAAPPTEEQARRFLLRALIHAGFIRGASMER